jgi:mono/diheme cytochrome c family protein
LALSAVAQTKTERIDFGKREFDAKCAACHGVTGRGDGPVAGYLTRKATDLTVLARANGGVLPMARLYEVVDGGSLPSHGTRDMPVWGRDYKIQAAEYYGELPYDPDAYVRGRILSLLEYINRLQAK